MAIFNNPHPLLDNEKGNFLDQEFNCELLESKIQGGLYSFHFEAEITEPNILNLIEKQTVLFVIKVDCKPYYSKVFNATTANPFEVNFNIEYEEIPADFSFEFTPLLIAKKTFSYQNSNAEFPMDSYSFNIKKNQILGSHNSLKLKFQRGYKLFDSGPLIRISKLPKNQNPRCGTMDIKLSEQFNIIVKLNENTFQKFKELNSLDSRLLDNILALPILQFALSDLNNNEQNKEKPWAQMLDQEFDILNLESQEDILKKCDEILKAPIPKFIDYFTSKYEN
ncbi:hypothetical protein [Polaribacter sp. KT 15]|uniref:hypothetical protein n=1 Tax=Polaribacter sp. KT 15 TaxID=1896175 RepID=UPI00090B4AC3|nr:hypothetical protein [Polaribacter sp. KT 15]SHM75847.1 hypothetical protein SAMN05720268_0398 [Polaribacter sp. KT 15]